ncbi:sulfotransferase [Sulfitobacter sp. F26204]|uniref:tetratricopeptide repeat-containing sulfotransferase family protein n=1 Tax=Sulfitobacter sp. F26204 TaxID=2996014 RepID=UPI00225E1D33|nr:tetratricopeptide repeat-containing sulfotransferase family protein [Sulfitobacter sp. F26204]MCX7561707.1 sulfotransferase [Sulfitobacter sp. F26204]
MTYQDDIQDANTYLQQGNYDRALKAALAAFKKSPLSPAALNLAGIASSANGRSDDAIRYFQKALKLKTDFPDAQKNLAQTLVLSGRYDVAITLLHRLSSERPEDWKVWFLKAQAEFGLGRDKNALQAIDAALALERKQPTLHHLRSTINLSLGRIQDGIDDLWQVLEINPNDVTALTNLSLPLARQTRSQDALKVVEKAVEIAPDNLPARYRLAAQFIEMGRSEEGIAQYESLLNIQHDHPGALEQLTKLLPREEVAALEARIQAALKRVSRNPEDRACLFFALHGALVAKGKFEEADKMLGRANKEMAGLRPYNIDADASVTQAILDRFPSEIQLERQNTTAFTPIFVIGLPRSGTTLVEAVLGLHPHVAPLGERGTVGFLLRDTIEQNLPFAQRDAEIIAQQDRRLLPDLPEGTVAYVDKMPENYRLVGFLKLIYPNARIINVQRDPRDIALSMWKSHFSGSVLSYTYDWAWMAAKFNLYARSMEHWRMTLPGEILDIDYRDLVEDIETAGHRMADFCGLAWYRHMARPDLSTTQVLTQSATQLRRPVHRESVGKWREKASLLTPFIAGLDHRLWFDYIQN